MLAARTGRADEFFCKLALADAKLGHAFVQQLLLGCRDSKLNHFKVFSNCLLRASYIDLLETANCHFAAENLSRHAHYATVQRVKISIIIPVKPGGYVAALEPLQRLAGDSPDYEVLVAEGKRPSRQRNMAAAAARGDILYFLDDDAVVQADALKRVTAAFADPAVAVVGGPSLTPATDTPFQKAIAWALSSAFGGGAIRNRYRRYGQRRDTDDSELILCNLAFRKDVYLANGGLDERLYPNEENELIDRLLASGARLLHDPDMYVTRSQRPTYQAFIRQMLTYGRGRAEQSLLARSLSFKAVIPALFVVYLLSLSFYTAFWYTLPACIYLLALSGQRADGHRLRGGSCGPETADHVSSAPLLLRLRLYRGASSAPLQKRQG